LLSCSEAYSCLLFLITSLPNLSTLVRTHQHSRISPAQDKGKEPVTYAYADTNCEEEEEDDDDYQEEEQQQDEEEEEEEDCQPQPLLEEDSEPDDLTCAICLNSIQLENLALIKGCDHMYCANCILHWAVHKESPWCPQCKQPFNYLLTYRALDGTLQDFPTEESVTLLKRALWFEDHVRRNLNDTSAAALLDESIAADDLAWHDYADDLDLDEDEIIEEYYFSAAAGRARVTLGNRRFGEGGYISAGRRQARPTNNKKGTTKKNSATKGKKNNTTNEINNNSSSTPAKSNTNDDGGCSTSTTIPAPTTIAVPGALSSSSLSLPMSMSMSNKSTPTLPVPPPRSCPVPVVLKSGSMSPSLHNTNGNGTNTPIMSHHSSGSGAMNIIHNSLLYGMSPAGSSGGSTPTLYGSSPSGFGRRARRNAKRAAIDAAAAAASQAQAAAAVGGSGNEVVTEEGFILPSQQQEEQQQVEAA